MTRLSSLLAPPAVAALLLAIAPAPAPAQDAAANPEAQGESSGRPLDGYFATSILVAGALFVVGKSARR